MHGKSAKTRQIPTFCSLSRADFLLSLRFCNSGVPKLQSNWLPTVARLWKAGRKVYPLIEPVLIEEGEQSPLYDEIKKWGIVVP